MKKTYRINVVQTVEVELDLETCNEDYLKAFSEVMWEVDGPEDIAGYIARQKAMFDGYNIEFVPDDYKATVVDDYTEEA
jgi:hypothetical protein